MSFYDQHNHSDISNALLGFPDVVCKTNDLIQRAYDLGLRGLSITEHEGISSHLKALKYYESMEKTRPFTLGLGNEIYLMEEWEDLENRENPNTYPYYHFVLTALDTEGHKQLRQLSTRAWIRAWKQGKIFRRPTYYSDLEEIVKPNQGHVIASTACLGSRVDKLLLEEWYNGGHFDKAIDELYRLETIFGIGNVYLEVQPSKDDTTDQSHVNTLMWALHKRTGVKIIPTTDTHYLSKEDAFIHKTFLQSQEGDREVDDFYATAYMMDENELRRYLRHDFSDEVIGKILEWSEEIAERIKGYDIRHDPIIPQIPERYIPDFTVTHTFKDYYDAYPDFAYYSMSNRPLHERYFFWQIEHGLESKVVNRQKDIEQYIARLNEEWHELRIISEKLDTSMPSYYSTMSQIIELIWEAGSLAMPARGSAAGFLTCYLLEVTQIDPVPLGDYMPSWRHLNHQRGVELPDIDNDSEASKKKAIVAKMKEYFGEDKVLNVATFSTISAKTALERACRGLKVPDDTAGYLKSLVPVNRGKVQDLKTCFNGDKENGIRPVYELVSEVKKYPHLKECCLAFEGLIVNRGTHAAGVVISNEPYTEYIAAMRSADGTLETCYDLWDSEEASLIKFDMLTTVCADKIHRTMDLLLANGKITWEGDLKSTYYKWVHPDVLTYTGKEMWDTLPSIYSVFQFDTPISVKALSATKPQSVMDLSAANSLLRLMPDGADETPIDRYTRYKESYQAWVDDTTNFGLDDSERECLWEYLSDAYGLADSQEKIMRLSMDKRVAGYGLKEANKLRKSIAKKSKKLQEEAKALFYQWGREQGTREVFLDYIWNVVFAASMGYSFSQLHSYSYSIVALQELNLNYFYPSVYWNCACLSIEASGIKDETVEDAKSKGIDYGEVAKAIYKMLQSHITVSPPDINLSGLDFTPNESTNSILYGLAGIAGINTDIAQQILSNRPYSSFQDFYTKNAYAGSLVTPSKFVQLVKGGCFDCFNKNRNRVMKQYVVLSMSPKESITTANLSNALKMGVQIPKPLISPYNFRKYVTSSRFFHDNHPKFKSKKIYWLDSKAKKFFDKNCVGVMKEGVDYWYEGDRLLVVDKAIDKVFKPTMDSLKAYLNTPEFVEEYNKACMREEYARICPNPDQNHMAFEACSYYPNGQHELDKMDFARYNISRFQDLPTEPEFVERSWGQRTWKQYELSAICGTVIDKEDTRHLITILTPENDVVNCKMNGGAYAHYKSQISEEVNGKNVVIDKPWIKRGNLLILCGYRRGDNDWVVKKYKNSVYNHQIQKIEQVYDDGSVDIVSQRAGSEENE